MVAVSVLATGAVLVGGRFWTPVRGFREEMVGQWRPAAAIALLFLGLYALGGRGFNPLGALVVLCHALLGLTLARRVGGHEPLPLAAALALRKGIGHQLLLAVGIALLVVPATQVAGGLGMAVGGALGEIHHTGEAMTAFSGSDWELLALMLSGAGIAEETTYRLLLLPLLWCLTGSRRLAIAGSALLFGVYHLTPLSGLYLTFWRFPVSQLLGSTFAGLLLGYVYTRRGYETVVLGHALSNWLPMMLFRG